MTYATLMVNLDLGSSNAGRLNIAADLARRFEATVIGMTACQPMQLADSGGCYVSGEFLETDRLDKAQQMKEAEAQFRIALAGAEALDWRSQMAFEPPSDFIAREARRADLVISGVATGSWLDSPRSAAIGDIVMQVGRPVLVVPAAAQRLDLECAIIGWTDTRETRRAVHDALPLLRKTGRVIAIEIAPENDLEAARSRLEDVRHWLARHGLRADIAALPSLGDDSSQMQSFASQNGSDLIVAGAYGHSRLREWALGGVTRDLLKQTDRCSLLSH